MARLPVGLMWSLLRTAGFTGLYVLATYAGRLTVLDSTNLSLVWPAAGISAIWFLAQYDSRWRGLDVLALAAATMVVNTSTGAPAVLAGYFVLANLLQVVVFVWLFRRWLPHLWGGGGTRPLARLTELWRLIAAAFLSTAAGALLGPTGVWLVNGVYSWPATAVWLTRNTVSILLIGVAGVRLGHLLHSYFARRSGVAARSGGGRRWWPALPARRWAEYVAVVVVSAGAYFLAFGLFHGLPLAFPLLVMTVWAGLRLHTGFVMAHDITFGTTAVLFTLHGLGPFAAIASHPVRALIAQLFVGMVAVVGLALALGRDERTTLIDELHTSRQAAAEQSRLLTAIVDSMSEGLTVVDAQGRLLLRNPAVRDLMGGVVSDSGALDKPGYYGLFRPDGTPLPAEEMAHRQALDGHDVRGMDVLIRNPGVPEGRILNVSATALPGEINGARYAVTVFHDVTAERRQRDDLAAFAGVVAHDLLNPLAIVEGWSENLVDAVAGGPDHPVAAEAAHGLVRIQRAAARMRHLINDLLGYAVARDASLTATTTDLDELVADLVAARTDQAQSAGTAVPVFRVGDLHSVHADPVLVRQLLDNLISNAVKYTAAGTVAHIGVDSARAGELVSVSVSDNGTGIPEGQHHSIFDNFHRGHHGAGPTGTGLGLGICKRIVERHGGTIIATDNPTGKGSRLVFTLPAAAPDRAVRQAGDRTPAPAGPDPAPPVQDPPATPLSALSPGDGFDFAARLVLDFLHDEIPLAFWAVTRVENGRQTYLYLDADNGYGLRQGQSHRWADSYCIHMAAGNAPTVALDARAVPVYAGAAVNSAIDIGTYAGAVITEPDGTLFGGICGLDPREHTGDPRMAAAAPLLALLGRLLTTVLAADRTQNRTTHALIHEQLSADTDALTGLPNRRAWQRLISEAQQRYERLADPTVVAMIDLDNLKTVNDTLGHDAGDAYLRAAATAARHAMRDHDIIARLGGDEFGLLLPNCPQTHAAGAMARISLALEAAGVEASIGWVPVTPDSGFSAALHQADTAMYAAKQQRRQTAARPEMSPTA